MYLHRPDLLSLAFGLAFTLIGLAAVLGHPVGTDPSVIASLLAIATGTGIIGSLATGDVHRSAAQRTPDDRGATVGDLAWLPDPADDHELFSVLDDPLLQGPIDAETLDREYRERFGDDVPPAGATG